MTIPQQQMINALVVHHDELVNYIHRRFGNRNFAIEVVQETCLRILTKKRDDFNSLHAALPLLKHISLQLAIDLYRRDQVRRQYIDEDLDWSEQVEIVAEQRLTLPELSLAKQQYQHIVVQAIHALPEACQEVFILTQLYHLTQHEAAAELGISRAMINKHLNRALQLLVPILFQQQDHIAS
ncbi:RNA polymerase sigma factor [Acinetobacter larvae]|uniref:RNA polymerase sigma factor 70 region 4 type 2 domain-containing protein n=1 Tax=Acinetobacter larvae TaxID=1789224 RepID=A0A1B2LXQ5_9GAMM|nr:RNA polymerase sigma factor [Acinetobacter larvae]AOA57752.1 hypothetical protein BFG52_04860 [Acinetobacter larvae]